MVRLRRIFSKKKCVLTAIPYTTIMKLKGEFHIIDVKNYGLRLIFTPDNEIIDKIRELVLFKIDQN